MIAIRRLVDGKPGEVEVLETAVGTVLIRDGRAQPANGPTPAAPEKELPHIDENLEVIGLTDVDPDFFEKQAEREAEEKDGGQVMDRMFRRGRRKAS